jgi:hypothetical protein
LQEIEYHTVLSGVNQGMKRLEDDVGLVGLIPDR